MVSYSAQSGREPSGQASFQAFRAGSRIRAQSGPCAGCSQILAIRSRNIGSPVAGRVVRKP